MKVAARFDEDAAEEHDAAVDLDVRRTVRREARREPYEIGRRGLAGSDFTSSRGKQQGKAQGRKQTGVAHRRRFLQESCLP